MASAIQDLRELVIGIRPPVLQDSGVAAALESRFERLPRTVSLDLGLVRGRRFSSEVEAAAYFVACEAVTNALKHADGSPIQVRLSAERDLVTVAVSDQGPGFATLTATQDGTGLAGLRDRVETLGGRIAVTSTPGAGCTVQAIMPAERPR